MKYEREQIEFSRKELAEILKKHLEIDKDIKAEVNYGNAGFTLYLEKPKQPTHEEIMIKWWKIDDYTWCRVSEYLTKTLNCYRIAGMWYNSQWFIGRESANIPPE